MLQSGILAKSQNHYICGSWLELMYTIIIQGVYIYVQVIVFANIGNSKCYDVVSLEFIWIILDVLTYYMNILTPIAMMTMGLINKLLAREGLLS